MCESGRRGAALVGQWSGPTIDEEVLCVQVATETRTPRSPRLEVLAEAVQQIAACTPGHQRARAAEERGPRSAPFLGIVGSRKDLTMKNFTAAIERDADTGLYVGWVPGFPGAHSQGESVDELRANLQEVIEMLLEEGDPRLESEFVGTQTVEVV